MVDFGLLQKPCRIHFKDGTQMEFGPTSDVEMVDGTVVVWGFTQDEDEPSPENGQHVFRESEIERIEPLSEED